MHILIDKTLKFYVVEKSKTTFTWTNIIFPDFLENSTFILLYFYANRNIEQQGSKLLQDQSSKKQNRLNTELNFQNL